MLLVILLAVAGCTGTMSGATTTDGGTESQSESSSAATSGTEAPQHEATPMGGAPEAAESEATEPEPAKPAPDAEDSADPAAADDESSEAPPDRGEPAAEAPSPVAAGCGMQAQGTNQFERYTIEVGGEAREYFLRIPRSYDPERRYPLVFRFHGSGGDGSSGGLDIEQSSRDNAIIASPSGRGGRWSFQRSGADVALFDALLAQLSDTLCVDRARVFAYGFSAGGTFANLLACVRSEQLRAVTAVSAGTRASDCGGPVAAMIIHGKQDEVVVIAEGEAARDQYLQLNGCSDESAPAPPAPCMAYTGCEADAPVMFCPTESPHNPQGAFSGPAAWTFFSGLN